MVCLSTPEPFYAIGEFYKEFEQVNDDTVRQILQRCEDSPLSQPMV